MTGEVSRPVYEDGGLRLWHGTNLEVLGADALGYPHHLGYHPDRLIPDGSYDSIVTDPPYELGFMGKGWDSSGIAYSVDVWRECLRVLKPGGHLLSFGGTRTWHRIAVAIEDAGFEVRDSIAWMYGSGFPKSMNVAKAVAATEAGFGGNSGAIRRATMGDSYTESGRQGNRDGAGRRDTGLNDHELALTENAEAWQGWGTALKPAFEPIIVARKPFRGTVAANVLAHGTGALNVDATRLDTMSEGPGTTPRAVDGGRRSSMAGDMDRVDYDASKGRWPTNVLLEQSQADALDAQTGVLSSGMMRAGTRAKSSGGDIYGKRGEFVTSGATYGDSGGASRFFPTFRYEAKAPTSERPNVEGTVHATVKPLELMRWLVRLVTRRGGRVLDIYAGSGTTGEAALLEGCEVDLIEMEADHIPLILARVKKPLQPSMFGDWEETA